MSCKEVLGLKCIGAYAVAKTYTIFLSMSPVSSTASLYSTFEISAPLTPR